MTTIVTFDAGQTLVELDLDFLAGRVAMCDVAVNSAALRAAEPAAWRHYDSLVEEGRLDHPALWRELMAKLLTGAGAHGDVTAAVCWLYDQQPSANLFRRPIDGMVELARELAGQGARVGVLSNSEGGLAALLDEIGIADAFEHIVDSARVGFAKPDRRIFDLIERKLGGGLISPISATRLNSPISPSSDAHDTRVHIGDSWAADIRGALDAGWCAIWFGRHARPGMTGSDGQRVRVATNARDVREALVHFGALA